ncbi:hypothetical protein KNW02_16870, partial [Paracoccus sp. XHP0099]|nr:hypothetical protein [Paracoccus marinaquae]
MQHRAGFSGFCTGTCKEHRYGVVAERRFEPSLRLSPAILGDAFDLRLAESVEAVHEGNADVD